jgi:branched-chain amino acid transport system ATP-binding protein
MLEFENVTLAYGPVLAVREASLRVEQGEIVTLIGANGAGKSTILRSVSRFVTPISGRILYEGEDLSAVRACKIVQRGIAHCPEGRQVLAKLSVLDNLELGAFARSDKVAIAEDLERMFGLFPRLKERRKQLSGTLSGGEQQMLAIGRALMSRPRLLLLDEPSLGLAPIIVEEIFGIIENLNKDGVTILLVEQNAHLALRAANRAYVLEAGRVVASGDAKALLDDEAVRRAYLG